MKHRIVVIALILTFCAARLFGQGTVVFDQQSSTQATVYEGGATLQTAQPFGQSFTPSLSVVGFIQLDLTTGPTVGGASVAVLLHSGSITGPTIGTSENVSLTSSFNGFVSFVFDTPPGVTPGTQYYFQPVVQSGSDPVIANYSDFYNYAGGVAIFNGTPGVDADLWFQEGIIVPEPSVCAVMLLGAGAFLWLRRRN